MITASEAKLLTEELDISEHTAFISVKIRDAAKAGLSSIDFMQEPYKSMAAKFTSEAMPRTVLALHQNGFRVEYIESSDQRDPSFTRVSW